MAESIATLRHLRVAPRKVRLVANLVRGRKVQEALDLLHFTKKSSASDVYKLLKSAVANAARKKGIDVDSLFVKKISVDQGPTLRRFMTRARGSSSRINKKTSHINLTLADE